MRLHLKILLLFLLAGVLPMIIMGGYSLVRVEQTVRATTQQSLLSLATEVGKEIQRAINEGYNAVHLLAENPVLLSRAATRDGLAEELGKTIRFYPILHDLTLINQDGHTRASVLHSFRGSWASTFWFQHARKGRSVLSDAHAQLYPFQVVTTVAVPVHDRDTKTVRDVLIGQIKMERIWDIVHNLSFGSGGKSYILDNRGMIVADSENPDEILRPAHIPGLMEAIHASNQGIAHLQYAGEKLVTAFVPVDTPGAELVATGWHIVLTQPTLMAYATAYQLRQGLLWTILLSFVAILLLGTLLSRQISRRVLTLVMAARRLGRGEFVMDLKNLGRDEIGELGQAFVQAGRQLDQSTRELRKYQEHLHDLVSQKTQELLSTNEQLRKEIDERRQSEKVRGQLEEQLRQSQKMDALGTLAGGIAHDFNNMLQAISSHVQLMMLRGENDSTQDSLGKIDKTVARASELVRRLLTFSRRADVKRSRVCLNSEVENVADLLRRTLPKTIRITTTLDPDLQPVLGDPIQIEQVLVNLAGNARDAMPTGGELIVETRNVLLDERQAPRYLDLKPGPYVRITISDTGCGMDKEVREHIFEPFFTTKGVGKGTGLGLPMVFGIIKDHQGHIACESTPGKGTTFTLFFPALAGNEYAEHDEERQHVQEHLTGEGTILVVDDEEMIRDVTRELLAGFGYSVLLAESGEQALDIYEHETAGIDLVITDIGMPGMGGEAFLDELLRRDSQAKVIVSSGYAPPESNQRLRRAAGFITKPYTLDDLLRLVRKILDTDHIPGQF